MFPHRKIYFPRYSHHPPFSSAVSLHTYNISKKIQKYINNYKSFGLLIYYTSINFEMRKITFFWISSQYVLSICIAHTHPYHTLTVITCWHFVVYYLLVLYPQSKILIKNSSKKKIIFFSFSQHFMTFVTRRAACISICVAVTADSSHFCKITKRIAFQNIQ